MTIFGTDAKAVAASIATALNYECKMLIKSASI